MPNVTVVKANPAQNKAPLLSLLVMEYLMVVTSKVGKVKSAMLDKEAHRSHVNYMTCRGAVVHFTLARREAARFHRLRRLVYLSV
jgi:hypothetical protein